MLSIPGIFIIVHGIGLLLLLIGILVQLPRLRDDTARVTLLSLVGAGTLLVSGLVLAGAAAASDVANWPKLAVKLLLAVAIFGGLVVHRNKRASKGLLLGMLLLTIVNATVAFVW